MAITLVQSTSTGSPAATSLAYSSNNTAGNLLVCIVTGFANGVSITVPTDTQGNTWNLATSGTTIAIFYAMNCRAGANTVTPADHGSGIAYEIAEFSGIATSSALDQAATGGSGQFPISVTTTANGELIIGMQIADAIGTSTPPTITVGSGLTADLNPIGTWVSSFPNGWSGASGYETQTNSGSFSMSKWTVSGPNSPSIQGGAIATFKAGGAVNGNATLTGLSLTSAAGQPIAGAIPFGQSLTSTQGTVSATGNGSATLTGVSLTSAMGQPIAGAIPFGQSLTTTEGSLFGSVTAPIIGQSLTTTPGAVFASSAVLTGQSLTASQGTLSATGGGNASLAGQSLTSAANSPVGGAGVALAGNSLSLAQGGITARFSGYTVVQQKSAARFPNSTTASQSVAFTSANTAANALFCLVMYQRGSGTNSEPTTRTVTDDQSNTWVELQHGYNSSTTPNAPQGLSLWMCSNPKGGVAPNVTATIFGSATWGFIEVRIAEISGGISWAADGGVATTCGIL